MKKIILCDIDGTIANNDHRQHFLEGKKDWDGFFDSLNMDKPIYKIINKVIEEHKNNKKIIFLTGRPERYRLSTTEWLQNYFNFEITMFMRSDDDKRDKLSIKKELFENNFKKEEIDYIIENDIALIEMWKSYDLKILDAS